MSQTAVKKVSFIAKAPSDSREIRSILDLASRVMEWESRSENEQDFPLPDNVIPFPSDR